MDGFTIIRLHLVAGVIDRKHLRRESKNALIQPMGTGNSLKGLAKARHCHTWLYKPNLLVC